MHASSLGSSYPGHCTGLYRYVDNVHVTARTHENGLSVNAMPDEGTYVYDGLGCELSTNDDGHVITTVDDSASNDNKAATYSFLK